MTRREFAAMVLKLLGVFAVLQALPLLQGIGMFLAVVADRDRWLLGVGLVLGSAVPFLLMAGAGVFLLLKSRWLARRLFREDSALGLGTGLSARDVQAVLFSAVGVLLLLDAVPRLLQIFVSASYALSSPLGVAVGRYHVRDVSIAALIVATQAGLGLWLFLRARGLANLWHRLQAGRYVRVEEARAEERDPNGPGTGE